jgi:hypothetical protein
MNSAIAAAGDGLAISFSGWKPENLFMRVVDIDIPTLEAQTLEKNNQQRYNSTKNGDVINRCG